MSNFTKLLDAATSNGADKFFTAPEGGEYAASAYGTFDSCTVTVNVSLDGDPSGETNGFSNSDSTFTAAGGVVLSLPKDARVWATVSSAGASTSVTCSIGMSSVIARN